MLKRIVLMLVVLTAFPGCAAYVAGIDADAALKIAAEANTVNLKAMAAARINEHDKGLEEIEAIFEGQLAKVTTGAQAVQELAKYRAAKGKAKAAKADALEKIQSTLNTGFCLESLATRSITLRAKWREFWGQIPGAYQLQVMAEAEVRRYMQNLNKGMTND